MAHFYDFVPESIRKLSIREVIDAYEAGADVPRQAFAGLTREQRIAFPVPGTWSIQQIVVHLMESDLVASYRMKRVIAEDNPAMDCYAEAAFAQRLFYDDIDLEDVCEIFKRHRRIMTIILRRLALADFQRVGRHPESGTVSLDTLVRVYVHHLDHHMKFVREKRAVLLGG
ncbi:MAG: DUF664 domain-containing protein [Phycisphaerales bacterium]|nr:DUF664 domain-containing protein [Phycisphaerales bacterium]